MEGVIPISGSSTGNIISTTFDITEPVQNSLEGNSEFHFSTVPQSTCHWDFGDRTPEAIGAFVEHTYLDAGIYTVTLTFRDDSGMIMATVQFEVVVT